MRNKRYVLIRPYLQKETRRWNFETIILDWETLQFRARKTRCMELCLFWDGKKCIGGCLITDNTGGKETFKTPNPEGVCDVFTSSCEVTPEESAGN